MFFYLPKLPVFFGNRQQSNARAGQKKTLQGTENLCDLRNLSPNIYQCFKIKNILLTTDYRLQVLIKHRMSTAVDFSVLRVNRLSTPTNDVSVFKILPQHCDVYYAGPMSKTNH